MVIRASVRPARPDVRPLTAGAAAIGSYYCNYCSTVMRSEGKTMINDDSGSADDFAPADLCYVVSYDHGGLVLWGYDHFVRHLREMLAWLDRHPKLKMGLDNEAWMYDWLAENQPAVLAEIRQALAKYPDRLGIATCTYGQPLANYLLDESNIRQIALGLETTRERLGLRRHDLRLLRARGLPADSADRPRTRAARRADADPLPDVRALSGVRRPHRLVAVARRHPSPMRSHLQEPGAPGQRAPRPPARPLRADHGGYLGPDPLSEQRVALILWTPSGSGSPTSARFWRPGSTTAA